MTLLIVMIGLSIVYRIGPSRSDARWRWVTLGSALAAVLLVAVLMIFTWYMAEFDSYDRIYGSLGAIVGFMTWIWLSVVIVLIGAELDAGIEKRTSSSAVVNWLNIPVRPRGSSTANRQLLKAARGSASLLSR